ncbi:MAG: HD domain-containing protein [Oligoflexia bacterium]|nr:HD domain-containing protein [Oligoflexia bacterium]
MVESKTQYGEYIINEIVPVVQKVFTDLAPIATGFPKNQIIFKGIEMKEEYLTCSELNSFTRIISNKLHGFFGMHSDRDFITESLKISGILDDADEKVEDLISSFHIDFLNQIYGNSKSLLNDLGYNFEIFSLNQMTGSDEVVTKNIDGLTAVYLRFQIGKYTVYISFCFTPPRKQLVEVKEEYFAVPVFSLADTDNISFDVYLYLSVNDKIIKVVNRDGTLDRKFKQKLINYQYDLLYIHKKDLEMYEEYIKEDFISKISRAKEIGLKDGKELVLHDYSEHMAELKQTVQSFFKAMVTSPDQGSTLLERCSNIIKDSISTLCGERDLFRRLNDVVQSLGKENNHYVNVSTFSLMFALALEIVDNQSLKDIGIAATLHDIGKINLPENLTEKSPLLMNDDELEQYKKHPEFSKKLLLDNKAHISELSYRMILEHHEAYDGSGFPLGLKYHQIHPYSQLLGIADRFDNLVSGFSPNKGLIPKDALDKMISDNTDEDLPTIFNPDILNALYKIMIC